MNERNCILSTYVWLGISQRLFFLLRLSLAWLEKYFKFFSLFCLKTWFFLGKKTKIRRINSISRYPWAGEKKYRLIFPKIRYMYAVLHVPYIYYMYIIGMFKRITVCNLVPWNPSFSATDRHCCSVTLFIMSTGSCKKKKNSRIIYFIVETSGFDIISNLLSNMHK